MARKGHGAGRLEVTAQARERHQDGRKQLAAEVDPMAQRKQQASAPAATTFEQATRQWWAHWSPSRSARQAAASTLLVNQGREVLALEVRYDGERSWRWARLPGGPLPGPGAQDGRKQLGRGRSDAQRKQQASAPAATTFEQATRQWWAHWSPSRSARHAEYVIRRLEADIFPEIGTCPWGHPGFGFPGCSQEKSKRGARFDVKRKTANHHVARIRSMQSC